MERSSVIDIAMECLSAGAGDYDPEEWQHCQRVEKLCATTAKELGWSPAEIADLRTTALLHHVDPSEIPESALSHRVAGYLTEFNRRMTEPVARLRVSDRGRSAEGASLIALADTFDRLVSNQRYRRSLSQSNAIEILRYDAETGFDKAAVEAFCRACAEESDTLQRKAA